MLGVGRKPLCNRRKTTCVSNKVKIGINTFLDSCIVYDNVELSECVIGNNCKIGKTSKLVHVVLGDNETLDEKTFLDNKAVWNQPKPEGYPDKQIGNPIEK